MKKIKEFSYSPGVLAKKIGTSRTTLLRHLEETELIDQCYRTSAGYLRIPYNVAVSLASPEALAVQTQTTKTIEVPRRQRIKSENNMPIPPKSSPSVAPVTLPDYAKIGRDLRMMGVTFPDLIKYIETQMGLRHKVEGGVTHEQKQNHNTRGNEDGSENPPDGSGFSNRTN